MKIAILGAAGVRTPLIVQALIERQERLGLSDLALMDIDSDHLELIAALAAPVGREKKARFSINPTTDARVALYGADFVITTFRVGGIASRVVDERVPLSYGVLGQETTGPGGFAMGMRTIPVLLDTLQLMGQVCPHAWLINFANPAGMMAEAAIRVAGWPRAVGICDSPAGMQRMAAALLSAPSEQVFLDYFGLNHLGWIRSVIYQGEDVLPAFLHRIQQAGGMPGLPFSIDLMLEMGMIPNEYLYYYYSSRQAVENILEAGQTRGEQILAWNAALFKELRRLYQAEDDAGMRATYHSYLAQRGETYMAAETAQNQSLKGLDPNLRAAIESGGYAGVALDLIEALNGGAARVLTLNVANHGAIEGMDEDDVVEVPVFAGKGFLHPLAVGKIPAHCLGLMQRVKAYERLTIAAAVEGSYRKARQALALHPLVADEALAGKILDGYCQRHGDLFPELA